MPYNIFIFPLLSGYIFLTYSKKLKYQNFDRNDYKLLLESALVGIGFLIAAYLIKLLVVLLFPKLPDIIYNSIPILKSNTYFATSFLSFVLSIITTFIYNSTEQREEKRLRALCKVIENQGSTLENVVKNAYLEKDLILITTVNGKCYIGWVRKLFAPNKFDFVNLHVIYSGFRNEAKQLEINNDYLTVYLDLINELEKDGQGKELNDLLDDIGSGIFVKTEEIMTINNFDIDFHERLRESEGSEV